MYYNKMLLKYKNGVFKLLDSLFNEELQIKMTNFFAQDLSKKGTIKKLKKNECIVCDNPNNLYIVLSGGINQIIVSKTGDEVLLYRLARGTIFGEMDFFEGQATKIIAKAVHNTVISVIRKEILENELIQHPELYRYFIHSIVRKYRILMLNIADSNFNDSIGKVAHVILRLSYTTKYKRLKKESFEYIDMSITHEELANRIGCDRSTVTTALNTLKSENLIDVKDRRIIIKDGKKLFDKYVNYYWE